jgi:seryl-tRNA(Sec) selenium transferase
MLSSTSQIDKALPYSFLCPWLGSGLLTSTGTVIEQHASNVSKVMKQHSVTLSKVKEQHSATVSMVIETNSATVNKVTKPHLVLLGDLNTLCYC